MSGDTEEKPGQVAHAGLVAVYGCATFSKGNPDKMCLSNKKGRRGCNLVNQRFDRTNS